MLCDDSVIKVATFSGPGSQYSPDCAGMYMDGQHMMRAAGEFSTSYSDKIAYEELRIGFVFQPCRFRRKQLQTSM